MDILDQDIQYLPGVGPNRKKILGDELSIHTYGDLYDADGNYLNTVSENTGVYYFHDEDIEWPDNYIRNRGEDQYLG